MWWLILRVNLAGPWCPDISSNIIWDVPVRVFIRMSCCSVAQSRLSLCEPMDCSTRGFPVLHHLPELAQSHVQRAGDAIQSSRPLSFPSPPAFSIRVFSNESVLHFRWPRYWSFSFSISPSNEYSGLIPLELTGWISLQSKGLLRVFYNATVQKHQFFNA